MTEQLGRYARLEGADGVGKTTQMQLAREYSERKGIHTVFVHEPGGTELGIMLRELILINTDVHLSPEVEFAMFTADRLHLMNTVILPALEEDSVVIGDRGIESSIAYQSAGSGVSKETILDVSSRLLHPRYMRPDALAILSLSHEARNRRLEKRFAHQGIDKIEARKGGYFERVHDEYKELEKLEYAQVVDADRDPEDVFKDLKPILFSKYMR